VRCLSGASLEREAEQHRLSRSGKGQANAALHRVVVVRMRAHGPTTNYVRRRTAEGKNKAEIIRCLKPFFAREIFRYLCAPAKSLRPCPEGS
jgi:hypothetical protein